MKPFVVGLLAGLSRQTPRIAVAAIAFVLCHSALGELPPPGWDEATHAGFPAVEIWDRLSNGEVVAAIHSAQRLEQYPPAYPTLLALVYLLAGPSWQVARAVTAALFALLSIFAAALADHAVGSRETTRAGWITQGLVLFSPMFVHFGRTIFLEIPFATVCTFAVLLYVKLERRELEALPPGRPKSPWIYGLPGLALAVALFTKWNYGVILCAVFAMERLLAMFHAETSPGRRLQASIALALPTAVLMLWWFVLPLPAGADTAASHRHAFLSFLTREQPEGVNWEALAIYGGWFFHLSPFVAAFVVMLLIPATMRRRAPGARVLWLLAIGFLGAVLWHPFKHGRFFIPGLVFLWILASTGFHVATVRLRSPGRAFATLLVMLLALLSCGRSGLTPARFGRDVDEEVLASWRDPYSSRWVPVPAVDGIEALARRLAVHLDGVSSLRLLRSSSELPPATFLWSLLLARAEVGSEDRRWARMRWIGTESPHHRDETPAGVLDLAAVYWKVPTWWNSAERHARLTRFLTAVDLVVLLDPGYAGGLRYRGESPESAATNAEVQREARSILDARPDFDRLPGPSWITLSARHPRVGIEMYRRRDSSP